MSYSTISEEYKKWFMTLSPTRQQMEVNRIRIDLKLYTERANRFDYLIKNELWLNIKEEDIIKEFGEDFIEKTKKKKRSIFNLFTQKDVSSCYV